MGLIKDANNGANVSVAAINGYTKENVIKAKRYLREIGNDRRNFPIEKLVDMYNDIKGTKEKAVGCRPCQATKFYNGIQNYAYFGELTLVNNNKCTKDDLNLELIDLAANSGFTSVQDYKTEAETVKEEIEETKKESIKERMKKVRAQKKAKKEKKDEEV